MHMLCTICSDLINQAENIYVTKCGHIFHHHCLAQWIERSKSCPQCRRKVTDSCMYRVYPTVCNEATSEDAATLQARLDDTALQLRQERAKAHADQEKLQALQADITSKEEVIKLTEKKLVNRDFAISALKDQMVYLKEQNKETNKLKAENEALKRNLETLNGLQKVLNATSEEVEQMLKGYTDLKTVATFATALKRALCESESKKRESRDLLSAAQHQLAVERSATVVLKERIQEIQQRMAVIQRKWSNKRKTSEICDESGEEPPKQPRRSNSPTSDSSNRTSDSFDLNCGMTENNGSLNSMVQCIQNSDSPYLILKQSSLALSALRQRAPSNVPTGNMKPSELALLNAARNSIKNPDNTSIFHKKEPLTAELSNNEPREDSNISYDGLGGHSKLDVFPVPKPRNVLNCIPKLTARHKLKRPTPPASQDIRNMLETMNEYSPSKK